MDYKEEQIQELEVLESIYPDELEVISNEYPKIEYKIRKLPIEFIPLDSSSFTVDSINQSHYLTIHFKNPETYPDCMPEIKVDALKMKKKLHRRRNADEYDESDSEYDSDGSDDSDEEVYIAGHDSDDEGSDDDKEKEIEYDDHGNPIASKLVDLPSQIELQDSEFLHDLITNKLPQKLEEDLIIGIPMIFNIVTMIKEECEIYLTEQLEIKEKEHDLKLKVKEEEEQQKFQGTKVTPETFKIWMSKFKKEMGIDKRDELRMKELHKGKLSGKEIFEQGLAGEEDDTVEE